LTDVGDAIEITFTGPTGATVTVTWIDPHGLHVLDTTAVPENPTGSGLYPLTVVGTTPGMWTALFTATGTVTAVQTFYQSFIDPTGPPPLATVGDYIDLFGPLPAARQTVVKALMRRASELVRDRYPGIDARITAGTVAANSAAMAVMNMAARVMRNPAGLRSETIGPISKSYDTDASSGWLTFTDADAALIDPTTTATTTGGARSTVRTIRIGAGLAPRRHGGWR
jgi:hypothetical protein